MGQPGLRKARMFGPDKIRPNLQPPVRVNLFLATTAQVPCSTVFGIATADIDFQSEEP